MMLEVSLETLIKNKLTAHQFLIVKLIHEKRFENLDKYIKSSKSLNNIEEDLNHLNNVGLIDLYNSTNPKDFKNIKVTSKFIKEMSEDDYFDELVNLYPVKVVRKNGVTDYLRTERASSRRLYEMIVARNKSKHEHIMKCLRYEVDLRSREGSLGYMKRLPNWLVSREWKSFEDRIVDSENVQNQEITKYGTEIE
ncbi:MAG: hypothetical protein ACOC3V_00565 [bacterium]